MFNKQLGEKKPREGDKRSWTIIVNHPDGDPLPYQHPDNTESVSRAVMSPFQQAKNLAGNGKLFRPQRGFSRPI